jgi:integrase
LSAALVILQRSARAAYASTDYEYHLSVILSAPRALSDAETLHERRRMLATEPTVAPLRTWADDLARRRGVVVPHFDPGESGVDSTVLMLYEAPGPMSNADNERPGSGFISVDNDDQTAENSWHARAAAGLSEGALHWNIVPWYLGPASKKPSSDEVAQGAMELRRLLPLLPRLRAVVLSGRFAQTGWRKHVSPFVGSAYTVIETWHPSPLSLNQPGHRDDYFRAIETAAGYADADFTPVFLTAAQVESIARELDAFHPYGLVIRFAAFTGLRAAEISGLRIRDVDLVAGHVEVRQTIKRVGGVWTTGTPKSARSTRNVPLLNRDLIADLREYLMQHPNSGEGDALFFPARSNGSRRLDYSRPIDTGGVRTYYMLPAVKRLGIAAHMRFHDLRHTYASLMLAAGFPPYQVSRWMGHANVSTTDGIYGHLYPSDYNDEIDKFERFVGGAHSTAILS